MFFRMFLELFMSPAAARASRNACMDQRIKDLGLWEAREQARLDAIEQDNMAVVLDAVPTAPPPPNPHPL